LARHEVHQATQGNTKQSEKKSGKNGVGGEGGSQIKIKTEKCKIDDEGKRKIINKQNAVGKSVTGQTDPSSATTQQKPSLNKQNPSSHHIYKYLI